MARHSVSDSSTAPHVTRAPEKESTGQRQGDGAPDPQRWKILAVLLVAIFMSLVGVSILNVGLASIQTGLGASQSQLQ